MKKLLIVESKKKEKTIQKMLGDSYIVIASIGHIFDLDKKNMGITFNDKSDINKGFDLNYKIISAKKECLKNIETNFKKYKNIIFATDGDREGEAIAYHIAKYLKVNLNESNRIIFNEITKPAIVNSLSNLNKINMNIVNSQQCRRILDRLVGFELSPVLWKYIQKDLSAGRVQSVLTKMIVDKENSIKDFKGDGFYKTSGNLFNDDNKNLQVILNTNFKNYEIATLFINDSINSKYTVSKVYDKEIKKSPEKPFTTSTFQQEANKRFNLSIKQIMNIAQDLYESGYITYHRTDSIIISDVAKNDIKKYVTDKFGQKYLKIRDYKNNNSNSQEAHEAIRPTNIFKESIESDSEINKKIYKLIHTRTIASMMQQAIYKEDIAEIKISNRKEIFICKYKSIIFKGYLKMYDNNNKEDDLTDEPFQLKVNDIVFKKIIESKQNISQPSPRYSEGTLIKQLEKNGIGRPSTYASMISIILSRNYCEKKSIKGTEIDLKLIKINKQNKINESSFKKLVGKEKNKLIPTVIGIKVNEFLVKYFDNIIDYKFTEKLENDLDDINNSGIDWKNIVYKYYNSYHPKIADISKNKDLYDVNIKKLGINSNNEIVEVYNGKFGPVIRYTLDNNIRYNKLPENLKLENVTLDDINIIESYPLYYGEYNSKSILLNKGRYGYYLKYNNKSYSIPDDIEISSISKDECINIIKNKDSTLLKDFGDIKVVMGKFGPYIKKNKKIVSVPKKIKPENLSKDLCIQLLNNKK